MSIQNSLIVRADDAYVVRPKSDADWQMFRRNQAPGSGTYHAMNKDGIVENLGGSVVLPQVFANALFVDAVYGNDTLAIPDSFMDSTNNTASHKFKTIVAAMTAASSGDVIVVYPGTYNESVSGSINLYKDGVAYYFYSGAIVTCRFFNDTTNAVCKVFGNGLFFSQPQFINNGSFDENILVSIKDGYFYIEGEDAINSNLDTLGPTYVFQIGSRSANQLNPQLITKFKNILSQDHTCVSMAATGPNAYLSVTFNQLSHLTDSQSNEAIVCEFSAGGTTWWQGKAYFKSTGKGIIGSPNGVSPNGPSIMEFFNRNSGGARALIDIESDIYSSFSGAAAINHLIRVDNIENTDINIRGNVYCNTQPFMRVFDSASEGSCVRFTGDIFTDALILQMSNATGLAAHQTVYMDGNFYSSTALGGTPSLINISGIGTQVPRLFLNGKLYNDTAIINGITLGANAELIFNTFTIMCFGGIPITSAVARQYRVIHSLAMDAATVNATNLIVGSNEYVDANIDLQEFF